MKFYSLEEALRAAAGEKAVIADRQPVYGGDINRAYRLTLSDGRFLFMKSNSVGNYSFFEAEQKGLNALRAAGTIGVPEALAIGIDSKKGISFLLTEYLEPGRKIKNYWETFGTELALLHRAEIGRFVSDNKEMRFGFQADNFIGASVQKNTPKTSWAEFFRDCRLKPQIEMAERRLDTALKKKCEKLLEKLNRFLPEPEFPSLLHGDLWSGNSLCGPDGKAWIFDPAVYVGSFEAELAMTELFGKLHGAFYGAYNEVNPIDKDYKQRRDLYNLYHMLNHLNLFGGSYLSSVRHILNRYV